MKCAIFNKCACYVPSGKVECALFGDYVASWNRFMAKRYDRLPIVVVQFAKVKIFRGMLCI